MSIKSQLKNLRVVPVISIDSADDAMPLADTLLEGGLGCAEITLRTPAALDAIKMMAKRGDILLGAGTVLTIDQVKAVMDSGARFTISPGFSQPLAEYCLDNDIIHIPGVCTPSEMQAASGLGLSLLKFFPAEALGGLKTLKAMSAPYQGLEFMPTGGISPENLGVYLGFSKVLACGGSWIATSGTC